MIYGLSAMVGLFVTLWAIRAAHDRRRSLERRSVSQREIFARLEEPERTVAANAVKLLHEEFRISFPILLEDRLAKDLGIDGEDINDFVQELSERCRRKLPNPDVGIHTVREAVRAVANSPLN